MAFQLSGNQIKTRIIDPTRYRANVNCEFKLDDVDVSYLPNMRLINLGVTGAATQTPQDIGGLANLIHDIRLYDGREEIDSLRYAGQWMSFQQLRDSNSKNVSVNNNLLKSNVGSIIARNSTSIQVLDAADVSENTLNTAESTTKAKAHLDLRELLGSLSQMNYLDSSVFKNLRLVIEFETDINFIQHKVGQDMTTIQPALVVDYTTAPNAPMRNISWLAIEHDEYSLPAAAAAAGATSALQQQSNNRINGFNNKSVERLLFVKQYSSNSIYNDGTDIDKFSTGSIANYRESWQFRVNGQNVMPTAIDSDSKIQVLMADTWGDINAPLASNLYNFINKTELDEAKVGKFAYAGVTISDYVKSLDVEHSRFVLDDTSNKKTNSGQRVHVFGEVRKSLVVKGGEYMVSYV
tara:strand:- start:1651 stop:2874 length:1224 start_codon:yes stop_codon:yes gene_type:complete